LDLARLRSESGHYQKGAAQNISSSAEKYKGKIKLQINQYDYQKYENICIFGLNTQDTATFPGII